MLKSKKNVSLKFSKNSEYSVCIGNRVFLNDMYLKNIVPDNKVSFFSLSMFKDDEYHVMIEDDYTFSSVAILNKNEVLDLIYVTEEIIKQFKVTVDKRKRSNVAVNKSVKFNYNFEKENCKANIEKVVKNYYKIFFNIKKYSFELTSFNIFTFYEAINVFE